MKISVIIPAFNEAKYIGACLDHVTRQKVDEVIVVDNGSTDKTVAIAKKYPKVRVVRERKKGVNHARHRGLIEAKGDIIAYVDADTHMPDTWVEKARKEFKADPELVLLSGPYIYYDHNPIEQAALALFWRLFAVPIYTIVGYLAIGGNCIARRSAIKRAGGFDPNIDFYGDDADFARRLYTAGKVKFDLDFYMYSSGRRFSKQGIISTGWHYIYNYLSVVVTKRPRTLEHRDIR